jgi:CHAT domain-containing protein/tetratricopeptide (TPR) repeat protein
MYPLLSRAIPLFLGLSLLFPAAARPVASPGLAACNAGFAAAPDTEASASCFLDAGLKDPAIAPAATARMKELLAAHPGQPWMTLYLGHTQTNEPEKALVLYRAAATAFASRGEARGEVLARGNLQRVLSSLGHNGEAKKEAERAEEVAVASRNPELIARSKIILARHLFRVGEGVERAYVLLREAKEFAFPDGPYFIKRDSLSWLGDVSLEMGRYPEARSNFEQAADLALAQHDSFGEATARYGIARAFLDHAAQAPQKTFKPEATALARQALAAAETGQNRNIEAKSHWLLGMLTEGAAAHGHLEQCLERANDIRNRSYCLDALARHLATEDPPRARETIREALALAHQAGDPWSMAYSWRERMRLSWTLSGAGSRAQETTRAVADSNAALDAIEALRDLQTGTGKAELFSSWSEDYSWLAGRLFQSWRRSGDRDDLSQAFGVMERMHARALLDALTAARAAPAASEETKVLQSGRSTLLEEISQVQRRLFDPDLPAQERQRARAELERLELAEADLRNQLSPVHPGLSSLRSPALTSLAQLQNALAPDEAFLSFQVAPDEDVFGGFGGGSWLLVSLRSGSRAYPLRRDRVALRPAVGLFTGLFEQRDGSEAAPAAGLYGILLADALRDLPSGIQRLVIVPDDVLHQLPFTALRAAAGAPPLAERYQITLVPSATLWLRWKGSRPAAAPAPLLAMADPLLPGMDAGTGRPAERAAVFADGLRLGALPFARQEGESAVDHLAGESVLRVGRKASEGFLKTADLRRFSILHFATHAVLDDQNPERSGVLLTPAPASEDGLLQIREIVPLHLDGRIVVLSSCRSASGTVLRGEGVLGIARAFFQAGAHTVVASLWPLRDDDGAALFDRFYAHLGEGLSVSRALGAAQRDRITAGAPSYAWAGLVVLGDGDLVPLPGGLPEPRLNLHLNLQLAAGFVLGLLLCALAALLVWSRRKKE